MSSAPGEAAAIAGRIRQSLESAQRHANALRRQNARLVYVGLVAAALATAVGGIASAHGPLAGTGPGAWKLTCGLTAALSACAAVASGLNQQLSLANRLARAMTCAGRLQALEIGISIRGRQPAEVAREYEELLASYDEFMT
jgi:hypothetical protein